MLAVPPSSTFGSAPRAWRVTLRHADLGYCHQRAGDLDLVAICGEHLEGATTERLGVVEEPRVGEHLGMVGVDLGQVAARLGGDVAGLRFLELGDRPWQIALQHAEVAEIVVGGGGRHDERLSERARHSDRLSKMAFRRPEVADLTEHSPEGDPRAHLAGAVAMPLQGATR